MDWAEKAAREIINMVNSETEGTAIRVPDITNAIDLFADIIRSHAPDCGELVEALKFYADSMNYDPDGAPGNEVGSALTRDNWEIDGGTIARTALAKWEEICQKK